MKSLAHAVICWPKLVFGIKDMIKGFNEYQLKRPMPPAAPLNPFILPWPSRPWIHVNFVAPF